MKKIVSLGLMVFMLFGVYGCGSISSEEGVDLLESSIENLRTEEEITITGSITYTIGEEKETNEVKIIRVLGETPVLYVDYGDGSEEWLVHDDGQYKRLVKDDEGEKYASSISESEFNEEVSGFNDLISSIFGDDLEEFTIEGRSRLFRSTILEVKFEYFEGEVEIKDDKIIAIRGSLEDYINLELNFERKASIPSYNIEDFLVF